MFFHFPDLLIWWVSHTMNAIGPSLDITRNMSLKISFTATRKLKNYRIFLIKALEGNWSLGWWEDRQVEQEQRLKEKQKSEKRKEEASEFKRRTEKKLLKDKFPDLYNELEQNGLQHLSEEQKKYERDFFERVL